MASSLEEIYQTCKALAEQTGETELVPMIKAIQAEITTLKVELLSAGTARQELMNDNLGFVEEIAALKE